MIKTDVKVPIGYKNEDVISALEARLPIKANEVRELRIVKQALNLSDRKNIHYDLFVAISLSDEREAGLLKMKKKVFPFELFSMQPPLCRFTSRPVVVGAGPAGLFCALLLAEAGARPLLLERGLAVDERAERVEKFINFGILDPECNVQFGEGGAGTFSDGKLKVGGLDKYKYKVLSEFVDAGAQEDKGKEEQ